MSKHTEEFKLSVIQYYLSGQGGRDYTAKKFNIVPALVRSWLAIYHRHGATGLKSGRKFAGQFKCEVVEHRQIHQLSYSETARYFGLPFSYVAAWDKIYQHKGKQALLSSKQGPTKMSPKTTVSKPDKEKSQAELLEEVEYLRTEVAYLKKLQALIQEQEQHALASKQKPSKR